MGGGGKVKEEGEGRQQSSEEREIRGTAQENGDGSGFVKIIDSF